MLLCNHDDNTNLFNVELYLIVGEGYCDAFSKIAFKGVNLIDSIYLFHYSRTRTHGDLAFERFFKKTDHYLSPPKAKLKCNLLF